MKLSIATKSGRKLPAKGRAARPVLGVRICTWCRSKFQYDRHDQKQCSKECRTAFHNWRKRWALRIFDAVLEWRMFRRKGSFSKMCRIISDVIAERRDILKHGGKTKPTQKKESKPTPLRRKQAS